MKPSLFTEEQILGILRGSRGEDDRRMPQTRINSATFYKLKGQIRRGRSSDAKRLKALNDENTKLKKLLVVALLDNTVPTDVPERMMDVRGQA